MIKMKNEKICRYINIIHSSLIRWETTIVPPHSDEKKEKREMICLTFCISNFFSPVQHNCTKSRVTKLTIRFRNTPLNIAVSYHAENRNSNYSRSARNLLSKLNIRKDNNWPMVDLEIADNTINTIPFFCSFCYRWVSLRQCSLATLQPTQFPVDGLSSLRVGHNPLVCNCSVHWLWNVLRAEERRNETRLELDVQDIVCVDEEFIGRALISLPEGSLRCRLSPLYLSLSAAGCLAATATILALIVHVTRSKRRKRPAYSAPNRPELLVYVGRGNDELDKNAESYSRRLIARNEEILYETPRRKTSQDSLDPRDANVYETPRYSRPNRRDRDPYERRQIEEGVYAVADVTGLARDEPPEVLSLYRMRTPSSLPRPSAPSVRDYDYEYDYEPTIPQKPHVVFVWTCVLGFTFYPSSLKEKFFSFLFVYSFFFVCVCVWELDREGVRKFFFQRVQCEDVLFQKQFIQWMNLTRIDSRKMYSC